jgi:hypothetical protein
MSRTFLFASTLAASTCAAILTSVGAARAEFATPPDAVALAAPEQPPRLAVADPNDRLWMSARFEGGASFLTSGAPGGFGRMAVEMLSTGTSLRSTGPVYGFMYGFEGWGTSRVGGGGLPMMLEGGVKTTHFVGTAGAGFNVFTVDKMAKDYGVGLFSPRAGLRLGLHFDPIEVVALADVQRRWQWTLPDMTVFQAGLAVGFMTDAAAKGSGRGSRSAKAGRGALVAW